MRAPAERLNKDAKENLPWNAAAIIPLLAMAVLISSCNGKANVLITIGWLNPTRVYEEKSGSLKSVPVLPEYEDGK